MEIDRLALPRPPAGLRVERDPGRIRVTVAAGSAWRRPMGLWARRTIWGAARIAVFVGVAGVAGVAAVAGDFQSFGLLGVICLLYAVLDVWLLWPTAAVLLRGETVYTFDARGLRQTGTAGARPEAVATTSWAAASPDPAAGEHQADAGPEQLQVNFGPLNAAQALWVERVIRRATRPARKAVRQRIAGDRAAGGPLIFEWRRSDLATTGLIAGVVASTAGILLGCEFETLIAPGSGVWIGSLMIGVGCVGLPATLWMLLAEPHRRRLTITTACVAAQAWRPGRRVRRGRARLEEVAAVKAGEAGASDGRSLSVEVGVAEVGRAGRSFAFRTPAGRRPTPFADALRQSLGLQRIDRGFPVVALGRGADPTEVRDDGLAHGGGASIRVSRERSERF